MREVEEPDAGTGPPFALDRPVEAVSRRTLGALAAGALASVAVGSGCSVSGSPDASRGGRLAARPREGVTTSRKSGRLGLGGERDGALLLPERSPSSPLPLLVLLHGAGGDGQRILRRLGPAAEEAGVAVLAPDSREATWDAIKFGFGLDVDFLNRALDHVFQTVAVDPGRLAIGGFSDGATYALSLGLVNGDLFPRVVAFSPGFVVGGTPHGQPRLFISHGKADPILSIDLCSRHIVRTLRARGYDVTFREFDGGHQVPPDVAREGLRWIAAAVPEVRPA